MNYLNLYGFCLSFILCCTKKFAQDRVSLKEPDHNKPPLFSNFPDKIAVDILELKNFISNTAAKGKEVNVRFIDKILPGFNRKIISATSKYNITLRSVVVSSTRFNGATLTLSSTATDGTVRYSGRIVSFQHDYLYA